MRVGTWNLEGRWSTSHQRVLEDLACDVWLLTENVPGARPRDYNLHLSAARMDERRHWAGIASHRELIPAPDPDIGSALAVIGGVPYCSSVLPWPLSGSGSPWTGRTHAERFDQALGRLSTALRGTDVIWGGDWNQPLGGDLRGFSKQAERRLVATLDDLGLQAPTATLAGRREPQSSIDHVAVPADWTVVDAVVHQVDPRLSDHDVYIVELELPQVHAE